MFVRLRPSARALLVLALAVGSSSVLPARDLHVDPQGSDLAPHDGSPARPFRTLQRAVDAMAPGDRCVVADGIYRETVRPPVSGLPGAPLRFVSRSPAAPGIRSGVVVSGADPVTGWVPVGDDPRFLPAARPHILRAPAPAAPVLQLFVRGEAMPEARFPNRLPGEPRLSRRSWANVSTTADSATIEGAHRPDGYWTGGRFIATWYYNWVANYADITDSTGATVRFAPGRFGTPPSGEQPQGYIVGVPGEIDQEGEWAVHGGVLYLWPPAGATPATLGAEARTRHLGFDLRNRRHVEIVGFAFEGCTLSLQDAEDCLVDACSIRHPRALFPWGDGFTRQAADTLDTQGVRNLYVVVPRATNVARLAWIELSSPDTGVTRRLSPSQAGSVSPGLTRAADGTGILKAGDWLSFPGVDLGLGRGSVRFCLGVADGSAGRDIELRLDRPDGPLIANLRTQPSGGFDRFALQSTLYGGWHGTGVEISGRRNRFQRSYVAHSWGDGISVWGEANTIEDCIVEDTNWSATDCAAVNVRGFGHRVERNTLRLAGRGLLVHRGLWAGSIRFNHLHDGGLLTRDLGLTYTFIDGMRDGYYTARPKTEADTTEIAYNWIHDAHAHDALEGGGVGVYLDGDSAWFRIHHNVIWRCGDGIGLNATLRNIEVANNTLWANDLGIYGNPALLSPELDVRIVGNLGLGPTTRGLSNYFHFTRNAPPPASQFRDNAERLAPLGLGVPQRDFRLRPVPASVLTDTGTGASDGVGAHAAATEAGDVPGAYWAAPSFSEAAPGMPGAVQVLPLGPDAVRLEWDPAPRAMHYRVERRRFNERVFQPVDLTEGGLDSASGRRWAVDRSLEPLTRYVYRVASGDDRGRLSPYSRGVAATTLGDGSALHLEAERHDGAIGVYPVPLPDGASAIGGTDGGEWLLFRAVDLSGGFRRFRARFSLSPQYAGQYVQVRLGSPSGRRIGALQTRPGPDNSTPFELAADLEDAEGVHDVYLIFGDLNGRGVGVGNFDWFRFEEPRRRTPLVPPPLRIEAEQADANSGFDSAPVGLSDLPGSTSRVASAGPSWIAFRSLPLSPLVRRLRIRLAVPPEQAGQPIEIRAGAAQGRLLGRMETRSTGGGSVFAEQTLDLAESPVGETLYVVLPARAGAAPGSGVFDWFQFEAVALPPTILRAPAPLDVELGSSFALGAEVAGRPATFQWFRDGVALPGAVTETFSVAVAAQEHAGAYSLAVTNAAGTVITPPVRVAIVVRPPSILRAPTDQTATVGDTVHLAVEADGTPPLTYRWSRDGALLEGITTPGLVLTAAERDSGRYAVEVRNLVGTTVAVSFSLRVVPRSQPPRFEVHPQGARLTEGAPLALEVSAAGFPAPRLQWLRDGVPMPGAVNARLTLSAVRLSDAGRYLVVASNESGTATSRAADVAVDPAGSAPVFVRHPESSAAEIGTDLILVAEASGTPQPRLQWLKNGVAMPGETGTALRLREVGESTAGAYACRAENALGKTESRPAEVAVVIPAHLTNVSARAWVAADRPLILGLGSAGGSVRVLVRGLGPGLLPFGVTSPAPDPVLDLHAGGVLRERNDDWPDALASESLRLGAFPLPVGSRDAALVSDLVGSATVQAGSSVPGDLLLECYAPRMGRARLGNVSVRHRLHGDGDALLVGIALAGTGTRRVLIRAVGEGLRIFGVTGTLADPMLALLDADGCVLQANDDWEPALASDIAAAGAFPLPPGSTDSALTVTLPAVRSYTLRVTGAAREGGDVLVEVFELP